MMRSRGHLLRALPRRRGLAGVLGALGALALSLGSSAASPLELAVPGFRSSFHVAPGGPGKRPLAVALHGNFDRAQWSCETWPEVLEGRAWLLCLRGIPRDDVPREHDRWTYPGRGRVRAELEAGIAALERRYPDRVTGAPYLLVGFSLGAILAARLAVAQPARFPRLFLVEGSHQVWTPPNVERFARGGQAVLFGCGNAGCGRRSRAICQLLRRRGVSCDEVTVPGLGHTYTDPLPRRAQPLFRKLVQSDGRWSPGRK